MRKRPQPLHRAPPPGSSIEPQQLLALFSAKDLNALIAAAFPVLQAAVPCDFATAFYRGAGNGLLKQRDSYGRLSSPAFMRRYMELTPALPMAMANPGVKILTTRTAVPVPAATLRKTAFYREIMQPEGWRHGVALCFWGTSPAALPIFVTSVYRREGKRDFSARDVAALKRIHPFNNGAVDRLHEREAARSHRDGIEIAVRGGTRGFAILDGNLTLVHANPTARRLRTIWMDEPAGTENSWRLPPLIEAACRELHRDWQSLLRDDPDAAGIRRPQPVTHPAVQGLTARISLVCPSTADLAQPTFVLELDRQPDGGTPGTPDDFAQVLQSMTAAERAVAMVVADGLSNQEIADRLGKTVYAVKFLLHRIYRKAGVPSRAALMALMRPR